MGLVDYATCKWVPKEIPEYILQDYPDLARQKKSGLEEWFLKTSCVEQVKTSSAPPCLRAMLELDAQQITAGGGEGEDENNAKLLTFSSPWALRWSLLMVKYQNPMEGT